MQATTIPATQIQARLANRPAVVAGSAALFAGLLAVAMLGSSGNPASATTLLPVGPTRAADPVAAAQAALDGWTIDAPVSVPAGDTPIDAAAARAAIVADRSISDPAAAAQAALDGWTIDAPASVPAGDTPIDAAAVRAAVVADRSISDPVAAAQAALDGWLVP